MAGHKAKHGHAEKRKPFVKIERDELPRLRQLSWEGKVLFLHALMTGAFEPREEETAGLTVTIGHGQFMANDRDLARELGLARNTLKAAKNGLKIQGLLDWWPAVDSPNSKTLYQLVEPGKWIRWHGRPGSESDSITAGRGSNGDPRRGSNGDPRNAGRGSNGDPRNAGRGSNGDPRNAGRGSKNDEILIHGMIAPVVQGSRDLSLSLCSHEGEREECARHAPASAFDPAPAGEHPQPSTPAELGMMLALMAEAVDIPLVHRGEDPIRDLRSVPGWLEDWVRAVGDPQQQPRGGTWEEVFLALKAEVKLSTWLQGKLPTFPGISLRWLARGQNDSPWGRVRLVLDGERRNWDDSERNASSPRERSWARKQVEQGGTARAAAQAAAERWASEQVAQPDQPEVRPTVALVLEPTGRETASDEQSQVVPEDAQRLFEGLKKALSRFGRVPGAARAALDGEP